MADEAPFYEGWGLEDTDVGYIQSKGFADPKSLYDSYRELERHMGADANSILKIPTGDDADFGEIWSKLGRPETEAGYEIGEGEVVEALRKKFHEVGLTKKQAEEISKFAGEWDAAHKPDPEAQEKKLEGIRSSQTEALKKDWGKDYEENAGLAKLAAAEASERIGLDDAALDKIGDAIGIDKAMKLFNALGQQFKSGSVNQRDYLAGKETPEIAKYRLQEMKGDPSFQKLIASGDKKALADMDRMIEISMKGK